MKRNIKKMAGGFLGMALGAMALTGCGITSSVHAESSEDVLKEGIVIVTTTFPIYDITRNVTKDIDGISVEILEDSGADLHNYQPTAADMALIKKSDLFIYNGGESDEWAMDMTGKDTNINALCLMDSLGDLAKEETLLEGMEEEDMEDEGGEGMAEEKDEHIWLSLKNAQAMVESIKEEIIKIDSKESLALDTNAKIYGQELKQLDDKYAKATEDAKKDGKNTLLFADRFPFSYMADDYGIECFAAFKGCSAETEASFETVTFLSGKVDEYDLKNVMVIEGSDRKIADTVIENSTDKDASIRELDSMQNITRDKIDAGESYLGIMKKNLEVLQEVL